MIFAISTRSGGYYPAPDRSENFRKFQVAMRIVDGAVLVAGRTSCRACRTRHAQATHMQSAISAIAAQISPVCRLRAMRPS